MSGALGITQTAYYEANLKVPETSLGPASTVFLEIHPPVLAAKYWRACAMHLASQKLKSVGAHKSS